MGSKDNTTLRKSTILCIAITRPLATFKKPPFLLSFSPFYPKPRINKQFRVRIWTGMDTANCLASIYSPALPY